MAEGDKTKPIEKPAAQKETAADKVVSEQKAAEDSLRQLFQNAKQQPVKPEGEQRQDKPADSPEKRMAAAQQNAGDRLRMDAKPDPKDGTASDKTAQSKAADQLLGEVAIVGKPPEEAKPAPAEDPVAMRKKADAIATAIDAACNKGGLFGAGTNHQAIIKSLEGTSEKEREVIKQAYKERTGITLEEEFADEMDKDSPEYVACMAALNRKDGSTGDAARLMVAIKDRAQIFLGRADQAIEQDVIDTVSTMNSTQIAKMKEEFMADPENAKKYPGGIEQAIQESDLSDKTKEAFKVFIEGNDKRGVDDVKKLVDIATKSGNLQLLEQTMRDTSKEVREQVAKDPDIDNKLKRAFGSPVIDQETGELLYASTPDLEQARGYMAEGHMRLSDSVNNSTSWLGDNEEAIEAAVKNMPDTERAEYLRGREMAETGKPPAGYTQKDSQTYKRIHAAFEKAGDPHEIARWDAMIEYPKGSLVETLSRHRGSIYDDSTDKVMKSIETMSKEDFERLQKNPRYLKQLTDTLATFADGKEYNADGTFADTEMGKLSKMLHDMKASKGQDTAVAQAGRTLLQRIDAKTGFNNDEEGIYAELEKMTDAEKRTLQTNPEEVRRLREKLRSVLDTGAELDQGMGMVDNIVAGKDAKGLLEKVQEQAQKTNTDEAQVIRDFRQALKDDPKLLERIKTDPEFKAKLTTALHEALDADEFDTYAKPLLENGALDIRTKMQLNNGVDDDELGAVKDILFASPEEKEKLLNDPAYREQAIGFLDEAEQKVALNVLRQGKMQAEDEIEIQMLGAGTGEEEIKKALKDLKPEEREAAALRYYEKYGMDKGQDLRTALIDEMGGKDKLDVLRTLERPTDARTEFNRRRDEYYNMRGLGEDWVDGAWDGTADDARARLNDYAAALSKATAAGGDLTDEERKKHSEALVEGLEQLARSQGAVADAAADAIITIGAIAGAKFTGGISLSLLAYTTAGAAFLRVGAHSALNSRFETFSAEGATQFGAGAADGLFAVVGGTEIAKVMQLGKKVAQESAELATKQLLREGTHLLAEGSEEALKRTLAQGTTSLVSEALATGGNVSREAIEQFADTLVRRELTGEAREQALKQIAGTLSQNLEAAILNETRETFKQALREISLNAAGGNLGATASAIPRAMLEFDPNHPEQFFMMIGASATIGTVAGGGMTAIIKGATESVQRLAQRGVNEADNASRELADAAASRTAHSADNAADNAPVSRVKESSTPIDESRARAAADIGDRQAASVSGNELGSGDGESGLWHPERDWRKMPDAEKQAILEAVEGRLPRLYDGSEQLDFAERALGIARGWDENLAPSLREVKRAQRNRIEKYEKYNQVVETLQDQGHDLTGRKMDRAYMENLLQDNPKGLKAMREFMDAAKKHEELFTEAERLEAVLRERVEQLQEVMNEFTDSRGMPRVQLRVGEHSDAAGGSYRAGKISINPAKLADTGNTADMLGTLYHELTHADQDAAIIHHLADELKIRSLAEATPEQLADLKALYNLRVMPDARPGVKLPESVFPEDYARQVLATRHPERLDLEGPNKMAGRFLSDDQALRAEGMADAFKINDPPGELYKDLETSYNIIQNRLKRYDAPNTEILLTQELGRTPPSGVVERMFGKEGPTPEWQRLMKRAKNGTFDTDDKAKVRELINKRLSDLNDGRKQAYAAYMQGVHEKEAHLVGEHMRGRARQLGGTETTAAPKRAKVAADVEPEVKEWELNLDGNSDEIDWGNMADFGSRAEAPDMPAPRAGTALDGAPLPPAVGADPPRGLAQYQIQMGDETIPIEKNKITLGRSSASDVTVGGSARVSRTHAEIEFTADGPVITNAKDGVHTFVNGKEITGPTRLRPGDRIGLADASEFIFGKKPGLEPFKQYRLQIGGAESVDFNQSTVILGRSSQSDVVISDINVSRTHAKIEFTEDGPIISNLRDTNATFVNGKEVKGPTQIKPGDKIKLGEEGPEFVFGDKSPATIPPKKVEPVRKAEYQGEEAIVRLADPFDQGKQIIEIPGRAQYASRMFDQTTVMQKYGPLGKVTLPGNDTPLYIAKDGTVFNQVKIGDKEPRYILEHKYRSINPSELKAVEQRAKIEPPPLPRPEPRPQPKPFDPRVLDDVPRAPGRPGGDRILDIHRDSPHYLRPEAYEGVGITVNGNRLNIDPVDGLKLERQSLNPSDKLISRDQGSLKWDAHAGSFYIEDRSLNGVHIKRPGEVGYTHYKDRKVFVGPHDEIMVGRTVVKLDSPNFPQSRYTGAMRATDVQAFFDGEPVSIKNGEIKLGLNHQSFGNQKQDVINKMVSREHANLRFDESRNQWILTDTTKAPKPSDYQHTVVAASGEPNGTYIKHADGTTTLLRGDQAGKESIALKPGDRVHLGHEEGPELKLVFGQGTDLQDGRIQFKRPNMDTVIRRPDGSQEITTFAGSKRVEDLQGRIVQTTDRGGLITRLSYDDNNKLSRITMPDGTAVVRVNDKWERVLNPEALAPSKHGDIHPEAIHGHPWWKGDIDVDPVDGSLRYSDKGKPPKVTIERLDGTREVIQPNGRVSYHDVNLPDEVGHMNRLWQNPDLFETFEERTRFKGLMNAFESRAKEAGLTPEQQALTFRHVRRLLEAGDTSLIPQNLRKDLAEQILNQASNPRLISQGANNTCNVTTIERRLFMRNPDEAARLIADVATNGKYVSADGTIVDLSRVPGALNPDSESRMLLNQPFSKEGADLHLDGRRTYASQIFETAAVNIKYARSQGNTRFGDVVLYQKKGLPGQEEEQLVRYYRDWDGSLKTQKTNDSPHIYTSELADIHNQILGRDEPNFVFMGPEDWKQPGVHVFKDNYGSSLRVPQNVDEFRKMMLQTNPNDFPIILTVHTGHPFFGQAGEGGAHVVNITNLRETGVGTNKFEVELLNQWGEKYNGTISLEDAYNLMNSPKTTPVPKSALRKHKPGEGQKAQQGFLKKLFS